MAQTKCIQCGVDFKVIPARLPTAKFCKRKCADEWRKANFIGQANPHYKGGPDCRVCANCGAEFQARAASSRRFCSRPCADKGGFRFSGEAHPNYKPTSRRKNRRGKHGAWARAVIGRDAATCQHCGSQDHLHAHHIKPFAEFPELRWDIGNGLTLCAQCHWAVHAASNANAVKSGDTLPGNAGGNPEPSFGRKPVEGVTTNGRAYRRWNGNCAHCGTFISKRWSDAKGKSYLCCSRSCASRHRMRLRYGSNTDTSAVPERDDIV